MAGVIFVGLQILEAGKIADQHGVVVALSHIDGHLAPQKLGNYPLKAPQPLKKAVLLRLGAGAEFPHNDVTDHTLPPFCILYHSNNLI